MIGQKVIVRDITTRPSPKDRHNYGVFNRHNYYTNEYGKEDYYNGRVLREEHNVGTNSRNWYHGRD